MVAGQTVGTAAGIVESEADDGEIGMVRQHIALKAGQTACGVIPADACADHIDLGAREEGMEDRFDLMGIAVFGFKDGIKTVFADAVDLKAAVCDAVAKKRDGHGRLTVHIVFLCRQFFDDFHMRIPRSGFVLCVRNLYCRRCR